MASCVAGELIPCAFSWYDLGITPVAKVLIVSVNGDSVALMSPHHRPPPPRIASITTKGIVLFQEVVPDDHLIREIATVLDLSWVRAKLAP
jgi:hypothetical protein